MTHFPLVSCIMPTADRGKFIPNAINYFLAQDYPNAELIIIDDGTSPIDHLIPRNERIRYFRFGSSKATIGTKRNKANELAKGDIIVHWDDDDWYAPNWISYQVHVLQVSGADICGLHELFFFSPGIRKLWKYVYPLNERPWVGGATMAYTKAIWRKYNFKNLQVGEDNDFVWHSGARVAAHPYINGFMSILHSKNTSPKYTDNHRWVLQHDDTVNPLLRKVIQHYQQTFH